VRVNGLTGLCVGHLDVLAGFETVQICTAYRKGGARITEFPAGDVSHLDGCEPEYETLPGWKDADITNVRRFEDLPANAKAYVRRVAEIAGVPAVLISIGPRRDQTLVPPETPPPSRLFEAPRRPVVAPVSGRVL